MTGGAGAIGSNLVRRLLGYGHDVVVVDDLSSGRRSGVPEGAELVVGSVTDGTVIDAAFASGPELVFHLAARFANQNSVDHPEDDLRVSGVGTLRVLERAVATGVRKVLVTSSSCVYGNGPSDDELGVHFATETPYAMTKMLAEGYARFFAAHHGLDTVIVRPFNTYGPGEHPGRYRNVIPNFLEAAIRQEPLVVTGTGDETRDFTFVEDTVAGMVLAMDAETAPGDVFNIASGVETRIVDLARAINELVGNPAGVVHQPRRDWDATTRRRGSIDRARAVLGYEPSVSLEIGLRRTHDWLRRILDEEAGGAHRTTTV